MGDTKGRILLTALQLFSRDGYEAVSVRNIAEALDMTKGALYRHYKNKRDIFDSIIDRMIEIDAQRAKDYQMPVEQYDELPDSYGNTSWKNIVQYTIEQLKFWTEDNFAVLFRRMLTLEQYRNAEMAELYSQCIVEGPVCAALPWIRRKWSTPAPHLTEPSGEESGCSSETRNQWYGCGMNPNPGRCIFLLKCHL